VVNQHGQNGAEHVHQHEHERENARSHQHGDDDLAEQIFLQRVHAKRPRVAPFPAGGRAMSMGKRRQESRHVAKAGHGSVKNETVARLARTGCFAVAEEILKIAAPKFLFG
jgi:hypothetical protein